MKELKMFINYFEQQNDLIFNLKDLRYDSLEIGTNHVINI